MEIGKLIKTLRVSTGLSQKDLSAQLDITGNYLSLVESSKRSPSKNLLQKIAEVFNISKGALEFICSEAPSELDDEKANTFRDLQSNIASLLFFKASHLNENH
jgi:transcriptional regulator with XRE-family HTH domain